MRNKKGQDEAFAYVLVLATMITLFLMVVSMIFFTGVSQTKDSLGSVRLSPPLLGEEIPKASKTFNDYLLKKLILDFQKLFIILLILAIVLLTKRIKKLSKKKRKK